MDITEAYYASGTDHIWKVGNMSLPTPIEKKTALFYMITIFLPFMLVIVATVKLVPSLFAALAGAAISVPINTYVQEKFEMPTLDLLKIIYIQAKINRSMDVINNKGKVVTFIVKE